MSITVNEQELRAAIAKVKRAAPLSDPPVVGQMLGETLEAMLDLVVAIDEAYLPPTGALVISGKESIEYALRKVGALGE